MEIRRDRKVLDEKTLFTQNEITNMLNTARHPRDKCLISLIYETAGRAHEILSLTISDVRFTDYGADIRVPDKTKTGSREIPIIDSVQYIKAWLNIHPDSKPDNPLIVSFNRINHCGTLTYRGALMQLKEIADKAGIKKPGRWGFHLFRHTQLTNMAQQGYNESLIRDKAGWTKNSRMVEIYVHPTKNDLVNAMLAKRGIQSIPQPLGIQLMKECPQCHNQVPVDAQFCENCSKHLDLSPIVRRLLEENQQTQAQIVENQQQNQEMLKQEMAKRDQEMEKMRQVMTEFQGFLEKGLSEELKKTKK
ncbi:MAG: tyrosine-type recombinase/integrase [Candidatus Methanoperedens sp.]